MSTERKLKDITDIEEEILEKLARCERLSPKEEHNLQANKRGRNKLYSRIIQSLTGLEFEESEALEHWEKILKHKYILSSQANRDVGIYVAALDYFKNIVKVGKEFCILDRKTLLDTYESLVSDQMTGLFNHRYFHEQLSRLIRYHKQGKDPLSLLMFDLDDFKKYNDTNGHLAGDVLIMEVARIMMSHVREDYDLPCRYGGEEFTVIFPHTSKEEALEVSNRIANSISHLKIPQAEHQPLGFVSISGGVSEFPLDASNKNDLIKVADDRLYLAKRSGKNRIIAAAS